MSINKQLSDTFRAQAYRIADWWLEHSLDRDRGGFYGAVRYDNSPMENSPRSVILNARILWFFSVVAQFAHTKERQQSYRNMARKSFEYLREYFVDKEYGGLYWMLDCDSKVIDDRKHSYAQAFAIYALSAYFDLTSDDEALQQAMKCFELLEEHARDFRFGGYFEASSRQWGHLDEVALSCKEDNSPKTMNTNLHVLEAYTGLHNTVSKSATYGPRVRSALNHALQMFCEKIVDLQSGHARMFMDEAWDDHSKAYSFGHDIEASWLIYEAISSLQGAGCSDHKYLQQVFRLGEVAYLDGMQANGSMADEFILTDERFTDTAWWIQAEAMVGFVTLWRLGKGDKYKEAALRVWDYAQSNFIDHTHGEWFWFPVTVQAPEDSEYKVGPWKAPYHAGRAMMYLSNLLIDNTEMVE